MKNCLIGIIAAIGVFGRQSQVQLGANSGYSGDLLSDVNVLSDLTVDATDSAAVARPLRRASLQSAVDLRALAVGVRGRRYSFRSSESAVQAAPASPPQRLNDLCFHGNFSIWIVHFPSAAQLLSELAALLSLSAR